MLEEKAGANPVAPVFSTGGSAGLLPFQAAVAMPSRERFYVELKPGETTFVSWKKLMKDAQRAGPSSSSEAPVGAHPALEARIAPEVASQKDPLPPPPNRFNSVIEKIERIYKGGNSSDENGNLSDFPDDDEYDTQDSFIDDEELNEYFSVDKAKTKHQGFFVNRGKLERESEPPSPVAAPKKRRRREIKKSSSDTNEDVSKKLKSGVRLKAAARTVPLSTVGISASFELPASKKQTTQKERKEARDLLSGLEAGNIGKISESDLVKAVVEDMVVSQYRKDIVRDGAEGREVLKGAAVERPMDNSSSAIVTVLQATEKSDANGALKRDGLVQLEQKEGSIMNLTKVKAAQKGVKDDDSRETVSVTGKPQQGSAKSSPPTGKEVSPARPKGTALEKAFQDLERGVAQLCPPSLILREPEQGKRNRLPRDVKQKLAKVARLAAKQGKITDELIERLMGILGHVMRVKTLKRNLKEMIERGLSAMQEKEGRLQDIKREVTEMVKSRVYTLQAQDVEQQEASSDDFQPLGSSAEKASTEGLYRWDHATEDKICDLYEQYVEGMDEHRGPQIRKLYGELAELWPNGWMDNIGIKHAVHRAKERKKQQNKPSNSKDDSRKRRRSSGKQKMDLGTERISFLDMNLPSQDQYPFEKVKGYDFRENEIDLNLTTDVQTSNVEKRKYCRKSPGKGLDNIEKRRKKVEGDPVLKKKIRRKLETGVGDTVAVPKKNSTMHAPLLISTANEKPPESPPWSMGGETGGVLPPSEYLF